jgi:hypothetical protein
MCCKDTVTQDVSCAQRILHHVYVSPHHHVYYVPEYDAEDVCTYVSDGESTVHCMDHGSQDVQKVDHGS